MTTTATGPWIVVPVAGNCRIFNMLTGEYHRGDNGAVRVYRDAETAESRAAKLNEREEQQP